MHDGTLEEICRARGTDGMRPEVFKRYQQYLREEVDPKLARLEAAEAENVSLKAQLAKKGRAA